MCHASIIVLTFVNKFTKYKETIKAIALISASIVVLIFVDKFAKDENQYNQNATFYLHTYVNVVCF